MTCTIYAALFAAMQLLSIAAGADPVVKPEGACNGGPMNS
jgi:hypothetical protein